MSKKLAEQVYSEGHRKVIVFSTQQQWAQDLTDAFVSRFTELGGVAVVEEVTLDDKDQRTSAARIKNANVDAVIFTNTATGDIGARRLKEAHYTGPLYSITMGADIIAASNGAMDGMRFLTSLTPSEEFTRKYQESYPGQVLDVGGDTSYDAVMLLATAMRETGSEEPKVIASYISSLKSYSGESGKLIFDGKRGVTKEFVEYKVVNGTAMRVD